MDDCDEIMNLGLADVSYMSIFNDFDETVTHDRDMFHGRIIDYISMITIDSTTADNHECNLGTGTNDLENDNGQAGGAFGLFDDSIDTGDITAKISGSNCDHESCVEDELLSNCDTKESFDDETNSNCNTTEKVDDETNSNCDTKEKVEDESVRLIGKNSISLDFVKHDHICQPFCLKNAFCDIDSVQKATFEDIVKVNLLRLPLLAEQ